MRNYLTELDLSVEETRRVLELAALLKGERAQGHYRTDLANRHVALYFEKPSVRTRVSFSVAVRELGGHVVELSGSNTKVGKGEDPRDFARVVGRYVSMLVARVFDQATLEEMAENAGIPVINALSDARHPCQALADMQTIIERFGRVEGLTLAFVGEGNNVAASTGLLAAQLGMEVVVASPRGYGLPDAILRLADGFAGRIRQVVDVQEAVEGAHVLYTDTWISMGQEAEAAERRAVFEGYRLDRAALQHAGRDAIVMHCLPAVRDEEIATELMFGASSAIWDQAENRLHAQKALILTLLDYV